MKVSAQISLALFWLVTVASCKINDFKRIALPMNTTDYNVRVDDTSENYRNCLFTWYPRYLLRIRPISLPQTCLFRQMSTLM